jgi:hypothetical protein
MMRAPGNDIQLCRLGENGLAIDDSKAHDKKKSLIGLGCQEVIREHQISIYVVSVIVQVVSMVMFRRFNTDLNQMGL